MNERIKELAEQAGFYFYDMHNVDGQDLGESIEADNWSAADKFAELIVKECITIINSEKYRVHSQGWNDAIEWADGMIKEHFGVEE